MIFDGLQRIGIAIKANTAQLNLPLPPPKGDIPL
jgi:hypothetical protein